MDKETVVKKKLVDCIEVTRYLQRETKTLVAIATAITKSLKGGGKVLTFGNGGSAADAQHITAELSGRFYLDRPSLAAIALTTNTSLLTAIANDYGYETIFIRQLQGLGKKGDVAFAISAGGNSSNVVLAIEEAKRLSMVTIGFTGKAGGKLAEIADYVIWIPSQDTPRIQEGHITAGHIVCQLVEQELFGEKR